MSRERVDKMADLIAAGMLANANEKDHIDDNDIDSIIDTARELAELYVRRAGRNTNTQTRSGAVEWPQCGCKDGICAAECPVGRCADCGETLRDA